MVFDTFQILKLDFIEKNDVPFPPITWGEMGRIHCTNGGSANWGKMGQEMYDQEIGNQNWF